MIKEFLQKRAKHLRTSISAYASETVRDLIEVYQQQHNQDTAQSVLKNHFAFWQKNEALLGGPTAIHWPKAPTTKDLTAMNVWTAHLLRTNPGTYERSNAAARIQALTEMLEIAESTFREVFGGTTETSRNRALIEYKARVLRMQWLLNKAHGRIVGAPITDDVLTEWEYPVRSAKM